MHVVGVWYGINIVCIGHFTPPVDLSDGPFKKWAAVHANKEETTLLIYLKSTGRYHRPIAYMFSFCWQRGVAVVFFFGVLYAVGFKYQLPWPRLIKRNRLCYVKIRRRKRKRYPLWAELKGEKVLQALCFCVELFTEMTGRGEEAWGMWGERGEALEASTHEQLVFQILMVLNTKRPCQIPTAEVSDGKWRKSAPWQGVIYILASFHYLNESIISQCNINSRKSTH